MGWKIGRLQWIMGCPDLYLLKHVSRNNSYCKPLLSLFLGYSERPPPRGPGTFTPTYFINGYLGSLFPGRIQVHTVRDIAPEGWEDLARYPNRR